MFQIKVIEKKKRLVFGNFFSFESLTVYEIMGKNIVEGVGHRTVWRMPPKATNTHTLRLCNIYCFSMITMVARCTNAPQC